MLRFGLFIIEDPQQSFEISRLPAARKNKFVLVVELRRINILRVPSNGLHLYIKNSKVFDVKMALRPSTRFRLFMRNSFYALSVISIFVKSRDPFYLIDN